MKILFITPYDNNYRYKSYTLKRIWKRVWKNKQGGLLKLFLNIGFKWHNKKNEKNQKATSKLY